jgi:hypothetical protein
VVSLLDRLQIFKAAAFTILLTHSCTRSLLIEMKSTTRMTNKIDMNSKMIGLALMYAKILSYLAVPVWRSVK